MRILYTVKGYTAMIKKSVLMITFCLLTITVIFAGCSGKTSKFTAFDLYNQTSAPIPYMLSDGKTVGAYINPVKAFCGFEVSLTTVSEAENKVMLAVYRYDTDYPTTIAGDPVAAGIFENVKTDEKLYLQFEDLPAGRYVLTVSADGSDVGIYRQAAVPSMEEKVHFYYHHLRLETGAFPFSVTFRTSNIKGLTASEVLALPDYSWNVEQEPENPDSGSES